jgi:two-component system phosphate regulon sensor histidine kinase PhoR
MKDDSRRLVAVMAISLLVGILTSQVMLCLVAGLLLFIWWQYRHMNQLLQWLRRKNSVEPPDNPGVIDEIAREFIFLRQHNKQRKKKLSRFLKSFRSSTTALPDAIVLLGKQGEIEWANEQAKSYLGIRWPQDAGQRVVNLVRHPDLIRFLSDMKESPEGKGRQFAAPGNAALILELKITPYGKSKHLLVARDVTQVQQDNRMRRDFIANASHELRTPLTVISGYLESLDREPEPDPVMLQKQISQMRSQADRMNRLVEDLLQLSLLETSDKAASVKPVPVPDVLDGLYREAQTLSGSMQHRFSLEIDQTLWLLGNQKELYSAFSNIVLNALHYTPDQGEIRIRWYADHWGAHFEVSDSGSGIAAQHIPRLTERFYRVDQGRSRAKGGTGLGLAIVKHVLERHDANLGIRSEPGKGSTFCCNFPVERIVHRQSGNDQQQTA